MYFESHALVEKRKYTEELAFYRRKLRQKSNNIAANVNGVDNSKEQDDSSSCIMPGTAEVETNKTQLFVSGGPFEPLPLVDSTASLQLDQDMRDYVVTILGKDKKS